jgi:hypothetical protein
MSARPRSKEIASGNDDSLKTLIRAVTRSQGDFSLILARCNSKAEQKRIAEQLKERCPVEIRELNLKPSAKTLYTTITEEVGYEQPSALMVYSLDSVNALDQVLVATNQVREEFRKFACPLVLWVSDRVLQKLIRLVPDFENWATSVEFATVVDEPSRQLQSVA